MDNQENFEGLIAYTVTPTPLPSNDVGELVGSNLLWLGFGMAAGLTLISLVVQKIINLFKQ